MAKTNTFEQTARDYEETYLQLTETRDKVQELNEKIVQETALLELDSAGNAEDIKRQLNTSIDNARTICYAEVKNCKQHPNAVQLRLLKDEHKQLHAEQRKQEAKLLVLEKRMNYLIHTQEIANRKVRVLQMN